MRIAWVAIAATCACGRTDFDPLDSSGAVVQHGLLTMTTETFVSVVVADADAAHAFLVFGVSVDSVQPSDSMVSGRFVGPNRIEFERGTAATLTRGVTRASTARATWFVVELPP